MSLLLAHTITLLAWHAQPGPLEIRSDSEYVVNGINFFMERRCLRAGESHEDLWRQVAQDLAARRPETFSIKWVKGHAKQIDIDRGRTTARDKWGNDAADRLATAGAKLHEAPAELIKAASDNRDQAEAVHNLFLQLMELRELREQAMQLPQSDEGDAEDGQLLPDMHLGPQVDPG